MKKLSLVFIVIFAVKMLSAATIRVDVVDSTAKIMPGESIIFEAWVHNIGSSATLFQATKTVKDVPDDWSTTICFGDKCYGPTVDQSDPVAANPGDSAFFDIAFNTDLIPAQGQVLMVFDDLINVEKDSVWFSVSTIIEPALELTALDTAAEGDAGGSYEVGGYVRNLTDSLLTVSAVRVQNELPVNWSTSICFDICVSPEQDTVTSVINAGDSLQFTLTFNTDTTAGTGNARLMFFAWGPTDTLFQDFAVTTVPVGIERTGNIVRSLRLLGNYPNPFNPQTIINYELRNTNFVKLDVYNVQGQKIVTLVKGKQGAGAHSVMFDAAGLPSGTYIYRLKAGGEIRYGKMLLIK